MKKTLFFPILFLCGIVIIGAWLSKPHLPMQYKDLVRQYLALREANDDTAYDLCYFKPKYEYIKAMMIEDLPPLTSIELEKVEKVNDQLFALLIKYESGDSPEKTYSEELYSFVGTIDGMDYIILNQSNLPYELVKNYSPPSTLQ